MAGLRCLTLALFAAMGHALQQPPAQAGRETEGALRLVSSKMDELHANLEKVKEDSLNAVSKQKSELDAKLQEMLVRNRKAESINARLAGDIMSLQEKNVELRNESIELEGECEQVASELQVMQSNITTAREFIARSINSSNASLHNSPVLQILAELDEKDTAAAFEKSHEKQLDAMEDLASKHVSMFQLDVTEKSPGTQALLDELIASWGSISGQQNTSHLSLEQAFEKEREKSDRHYATLLQEQTELNATKQTQETLNVKLVAAVAHLKVAREHLVEEKVALQRFANRLGYKPIPGRATVPASNVAVPRVAVDESAASSFEETSAVGGVVGAASWLKSRLR